MDNWWDFCGTFWKGPGWCPGGGRLGDVSQVAEVPVRAKHEVVVYCTVLYYTVLYCTGGGVRAAARLHPPTLRPRLPPGHHRGYPGQGEGELELQAKVREDYTITEK